MGTINVDNIKDAAGGKAVNVGDNSIIIDSAGAVTINEDSADVDFRVEGNGDAIC